MFGMGMSEILVILLVAALFLGPEKLPDAATKISKGIRDLRRQTRDLQETIENDTEIGGAIRDLKSALRGEDLRRPPVRKVPPAAPAPALEAAAAAAAAVAATEQALTPPEHDHDHDHELATDHPAPAEPEAAAAVAAPAVTLPATAGDAEVEAPVADEAAELAALVRPAVGTIKRDSHGTN